MSSYVFRNLFFYLNNVICVILGVRRGCFLCEMNNIYLHLTDTLKYNDSDCRATTTLILVVSTTTTTIIWGDWKCGSGKCGSRSQGWKMQE